MTPVNLADRLAGITDHWRPVVVASLNGQEVKLVKFRGEFVWHKHDAEDELFLVVAGRFRMEFRDRTVDLAAGELLVVPRGVEHRPVADDEVSVLLFEPARRPQHRRRGPPDADRPGLTPAPPPATSRLGGGIPVRLVHVTLLLLAAGCAGRSMPSLADRPTPLAAGYNPVPSWWTRRPLPPSGRRWTPAPCTPPPSWSAPSVRPVGHRPPARKSVLCLSGGGAYGAYTAGVLCGWSERGDRPTFDVVTGISTGALAAPLAFLGPDYDADLRTFYTTLKNEDLYRVRRSVRAVFADSLADTGPLARKVDEVITPGVLARLAAEHAKGRRLYIGTTELESRRQVVWDVGAIAARGRPDDLELVRKVLLASAAIPGFFPPVNIPVTVDGKHLMERHVDGGVSASLFYRAPHLTDAERADPAALSDSDLYMIVAGKLYADPNRVQPWSLSIAGESVAAIIYSQSRGDLMRLYTACVLTGMRYHLAAIPPEFAAPTSSTDFNPADMKRMFDLGAATAKDATAWRDTPPGLGAGEGSFPRQGTDLVRSAPVAAK